MLSNHIPITKLVSRVQSVLKRVIRFCVTPLNVVKFPPTNILPPVSTATAFTVQSNHHGAIVGSNDHVVARRIKYLLADPENDVNIHHANRSQLQSIFMLFTVLLNPTSPPLNIVSFLPVLVKRVIRFCVTPLNTVNSHPTTILPPASIAIVFTMSLNPTSPPLNIISLLPVLVKRVIRFCVTPLNVVNSHPTTILPPASIAIAYTPASNPPHHIANVVSLLPVLVKRVI